MVARSVSQVRVASSGQPSARACTAACRTVQCSSVVARSVSQGAGGLVGPALGQRLHRRPPDVLVLVGGGAVGEPGAGGLVGPALGQRLHRRLPDVLVLVGGGAVGEQGAGGLVGPALGQRLHRRLPDVLGARRWWRGR